MYEEFIIFIKNYFLKNGYFGFVMFEVLFIDYGKFMVDLNLWVGGEISYFFFVWYMVLVFGLKYFVMFFENMYNVFGKWLV